MTQFAPDPDTIPLSDDPSLNRSMRTHHRAWRKREWLWSVLVVCACTMIASLLSPYLELVDLVMVYLLGVVVTASRSSTWPSLFTTFLSIAAFDFFFVPPYYTFAVSDRVYVVTFAVMLIVSLVISRLTLRVRQQAEASRLRERRTASLYDLSRDLVRERDTKRLSEIAAKHIAEVFGSQVVILVPDEQNLLITSARSEESFVLDERELSAAQSTFEHHQPAGQGVDRLPGVKTLYLPLIASAGTVGIVGIRPGVIARAFDREQLHYLEAFVNQTAMAIERAFLVDETHHALLKAETESLRNTMLSSISHDLRTPLTAITGAVSTLLQNDIALDKHNRLELLETIQEEAQRLNRIVKNILDMTRLESGAIKVNKEWQSLEEIVGVVLNRLGDRLNDHPVRVKFPGNLPLVPFDGLLLEQVFMNLFENAIKYTSKGTPLELSASESFYTVTVELADRGPGISPGEEEHIFEKFVRSRTTGGGAGLGLAICRTIINAHGGKIWVENRPGGGAVFCFTLSAAGLPPLPKVEDGEEGLEGR